MSDDGILEEHLSTVTVVAYHRRPVVVYTSALMESFVGFWPTMVISQLYEDLRWRSVAYTEDLNIEHLKDDRE